MDLQMVASIFGAVSGGLSLTTVIIVVGTYKERIDRHERWFNLLVEESLIRAWKGGAVERGSFKSNPRIVAALPEHVRETCQRVAQRFRGIESYMQISEAILQEVDGTLGELVATSELNLTPLEMLGVLTAYTSDLQRLE